MRSGTRATDGLLIVKSGVVVGIVIIASAAATSCGIIWFPTVRGAVRPLSAAVALDGEAVDELRNGMWSEVLLAIAVLGVDRGARVHRAGPRSSKPLAHGQRAHTVHASTSTDRFAYDVRSSRLVRPEHDRDHANAPSQSPEFMPASMTATHHRRRSAKPARCCCSPRSPTAASSPAQILTNAPFAPRVRPERRHDHRSRRSRPQHPLTRGVRCNTERMRSVLHDGGGRDDAPRGQPFSPR